MAAGSPTLLVTGASGKLGRRVVELLLESGRSDVIAATRNPDKLADLAERGVEVRKANFDEPASLEPAFRGAERMLLISTDTLEPPKTRVRQHRAAIQAAETAGVAHVVYTSALAPLPSPAGSVSDDHFWTEQALVSSGMTWTILRHHIYTDMLLLSLPQAVATGKLFGAVGKGARSYVTREDCARTDAAALSSSSMDCLLYDLTGPELHTQPELAALVGEITGRRVEYIDLPPEALRQGMLQAGLHPVFVNAMLVFDVDASRGYQAVCTPTVRELTGREPTTVREFLTQHRTALIGGG